MPLGKMVDRDAIDLFVTHLGRQRGYAKLVVDRWPEDENRQSPEIDAIAGPFAIEHTSIDSVAHQRRADDRFSRVAGGLDPVIADYVDCGFTITLEFDAIKTGMDWDGIREDLRSWIVDHAARLDHGKHRISLPTSVPVENQIVFHVWKGQRPAIKGFRCFEPEDDSLPARVREIMDRKTAKLGKYQGPDSTTILLIENDDIALMNERKMLDAILGEYPDGLPRGVDEVRFVDTSIPTDPLFLDFTMDISAAAWST